MKLYQIFCILFIGLVFTGCSGISVRDDYDPQTDFSGLKTYDWMAPLENSGVDAINLERIKKSVNAQLKSKGLAVASENPDMRIAVQFGKKNKIQTHNTSVGVGYRRGHMSTGVATTQYEEGTLVLDFVDAKSDTLIWRGTARSNIRNLKTPEKRQKYLDTVIEKILKNFPPK